MGAQISKTAGKEEVAAEGAAVAAKSNGQENGHAKSNGDASPATEEANHANGGTPGDEVPKEAVEKVEVVEANGDKEPAATNGEASAKPEEEGALTTSEDGKQKKKRFSFKKPSFKLSGFSLRKTKKESEEGADEGAAAPAEGEKAASEEEAPAAAAAAAEEEAKPTEAAEGTAKEAPAEEPKPEEVKAEEKPAEASPAEPETAASPEAPATAE